MQEICGNINESLLLFDWQFKPQPNLARAFEVSPDGLTYTFYLRPDVQWHDGVKFTARDVAFSCGVMLPQLNPRSRNAFGHIAETRMPDDYTVVFTLSRPFNAFLLSLDGVQRPDDAGAYFRRHGFPHQPLQFQARRHRTFQVRRVASRALHPPGAQRALLAAGPARHGRHLLPRLSHAGTAHGGDGDRRGGHRHGRRYRHRGDFANARQSQYRGAPRRLYRHRRNRGDGTQHAALAVQRPPVPRRLPACGGPRIPGQGDQFRRGQGGAQPDSLHRALS